MHKLQITLQLKTKLLLHVFIVFVINKSLQLLEVPSVLVPSVL